MANPKVSILVPDISSNIVWAATALARSLEDRFEVQVVGPDLGGGVCEMYRDAFSYTVVSTPRLYRYPDFLWERRRIERAVSGDVVIAVKAYMNTVPLALRLKRKRGVKTLVYLDEWDSANFRALPWRKRLKRKFQDLHHPLEDCYFPHVERMIPHADGVICTSSFLSKRFAGSIVPIGVDTDFYAPRNPSETSELKRSLGMNEDRLIVFGGVVRPHKGVEELLEALARVGDESIRLLVVGPQTEFLRELQRVDRYAPYIVCIGAKPKNEMPRYLALGELVVLPQKNTLLAQSQVPCKVFEAMAMAKPIIASDVSDLSDILSGCGWIVPPDDIPALAKAIAHAFAHTEEGKRLGDKAREKCVREYDRRVTAERLVGLVGRLG
jgi:glycosyltransferase involved in cell wall biosynthesis